MRFSFSSYSDLGGRSINEDSVMVKEDSKTLLAIVADGLGGYGNGEMASREAISEISRLLQGREVSTERLESAVACAHDSIKKKQSALQKDMRTTVACVWLEDDVARACHVGDSRIYQFRGGKIVYQSMDHSLAQLEVMMGNLRADELRTYPKRNVLLRALGSADAPKPEVTLLCSDGFWEMIREDEMIQTMQKSRNAKVWLAAMRTLVRQRIGKDSDNNSAIAMMIGK